jgi:nucleotide-binding universal stress UspA family protein
VPPPIAVGYDVMAPDRAPVEFGVAAARCTGASLIIACAYASVTASERLGLSQTNGFLQKLGENGYGLSTAGIQIEWREVHGANVARARHETTEFLRAGLLVVGSARRGTRRALPGSLVERIMHGATCPIAVVPYGWQPAGGCNTIGVACIDTAEGREALCGAHALARQVRATLRVVTAIGADSEGAGVAACAAGERGARAMLAKLGSDVAVETTAVEGDPVDVLAQASRNLNVLVCGSRAYGRRGVVSLGGVGRWVALEAHCPVITLPRGAEFREPEGRRAVPWLRSAARTGKQNGELGLQPRVRYDRL